MSDKFRLRRATDFMRTGVWTTDESHLKYPPLRWLVRQLRVILYTVRSITTHGSGIRPAALTFYTVMALVPILALAFGIMKGFGLEQLIDDSLVDKFPQYGTLMNDILSYAEGLLTRTKGSLVVVSGVAVLLWAVAKVFINVENSFNIIWEVKRSRGWGRRVSTYVAMIFVIPLLIVVFGGASTYVGEIFGTEIIGTVALKFISVGTIVAVFWLLYMVIPNTKVHPLNALKGALVAGVAFFFFQTGYYALQRGVATYNIIYGSFAAIPLFLIWVQSGWMILIYGAELSFGYQNIGSYMQERRIEGISHALRRRITLGVMLHVVRNFVDAKPPLTSAELSAELELPVRMVRDVLFDLEEALLVVALNSDRDERLTQYMPAHDVHQLTLYGVLDAVERNSSGTEDFSEYGGDLTIVSRLLHKLSEEALTSPNNKKFVELI